MTNIAIANSRRAGRHVATGGLWAHRLLAALGTTVVALAGYALFQPPPASAGYSATPSLKEPYRACPLPAPGHFECEALVVPLPTISGAHPGLRTRPQLEGSGKEGGYSPQDLRSAYKLPAKGGLGQTVVIVDAFDDPNAGADLKVYRSQYKLPACPEENGCFKKVNQAGETGNYPVPSVSWAGEISLDVDMVSAVCPECHILLVEATTNAWANMGAAENMAVKLGANEVSNSWAGKENSWSKLAEEEYDAKYLKHPKIPLLFAAGDNAYGVEWPAASQYGVAVGGTKLMKANTSREWAEKVWSKTGSGCSAFEAKPKWQTVIKACATRMVGDVSAVASTETPVSLYNSYGSKGWVNYGGTSVATPILAAVEAISNKAVREAGSEFFWIGATKLFDVTEGNNGTCTPPAEDELFCTARVGYDGPTGWGTPNGTQ
ncbi:MAG: S8 family serine peptidase [Solirubrobacterales bacterium]